MTFVAGGISMATQYRQLAFQGRDACGALTLCKNWPDSECKGVKLIHLLTRISELAFCTPQQRILCEAVLKKKGQTPRRRRSGHAL